MERQLTALAPTASVAYFKRLVGQLRLIGAGDQVEKERWAVWSEWQAANGTFVHVQMARRAAGAGGRLLEAAILRKQPLFFVSNRVVRRVKPIEA